MVIGKIFRECLIDLSGFSEEIIDKCDGKESLYVELLKANEIVLTYRLIKLNYGYSKSPLKSIVDKEILCIKDKIYRINTLIDYIENPNSIELEIESIKECH